MTAVCRIMYCMLCAWGHYDLKYSLCHGGDMHSANIYIYIYIAVRAHCNPLDIYVYRFAMLKYYFTFRSLHV